MERLNHRIIQVSLGKHVGQAREIQFLASSHYSPYFVHHFVQNPITALQSIHRND